MYGHAAATRLLSPAPIPAWRPDLADSAAAAATAASRPAAAQPSWWANFARYRCASNPPTTLQSPRKWRERGRAATDTAAAATAAATAATAATTTVTAAVRQRARLGVRRRRAGAGLERGGAQDPRVDRAAAGPGDSGAGAAGAEQEARAVSAAGAHSVAFVWCVGVCAGLVDGWAKRY